MWTTALQVGQLVQTVGKAHSPAEIRLFVCHPCPSREPLLAQLAVCLRADFTVSSGLHFFYGSSFNEFTAEPTYDHFRGKLASARAQFMDIWETVEAQVTRLVESDGHMKLLLNLALDVFKRMPTAASQPTTPNDYLLQAFRNIWNFNLCDVEHGTLVLNVVDGKVSMEQRSQGFSFQMRKNKAAAAGANTNGPNKHDVRATPPPTTPRSARATSAKADTRVSTKAGSAADNDSAATAPPADTKAADEPVSEPAADAKVADDDSLEQAGAGQQDLSPALEARANGSTSGVVGDESAGTDRKESEESLRPGLWLANGSGTEEEIKNYFAQEDRSLIQEVTVRSAFSQPDKKFALVYFGSNQEAQSALERVDQEKAGRVSIIGARSSHRGRGGFSRGGVRGRGRGRGGFRGSSGGPTGSSPGAGPSPSKASS
jgi:hypothetical protein